MADRAGTGTHAVPRREPEGERFVELVVVRHGETSWNASRIVQGQMDPELNEIGRRQAVVVALRLSREARPAAVYSSDLKRAAETAEIIAKACGVPNVLLNEALRERHMGHLQGLKWDDAVNKNPGVFKGFDIFEIKKELDFDERNYELPGGGESLNQLSERCVSYLNKVAQYHIGERVIAVSHGAAIMELCRHTDPLNNSVRRKIPNTSLNIFRISGATGQWILEKLLPRITPLRRHRRRNRNHSPNQLITPAVAASLADVLATRSTNPTWARSLAALLPTPLSDARLAAAVSSLPDPDLALALLSWSQSPDHHHHHGALHPGATPLAHSALLRLLARSRRFDAVDDTLRSMSLAGAAPTPASLGALVAAYADSGVLGKATEMCERVREMYGLLPEVTHCNQLLRLLVEQRRWDDARKLYDEMLGEENGADNYSTCVLVRGLCLEGRVEEGLRLIEARWGSGCIPHIVFYNVLIDGYCRRGDIGRGLLLLGEMETKGFLPTDVTYGSLINWLGKKGDLEKIGSLFSEMRKRGLPPNVQIYNCVIDALCKCRSAKQALMVLKQMFASGCDPDIVTFNTLISGLCHEGHVRVAEHFLREAIRRELNPNQLSYTPLIHGFCMRKELMAASDLLVEMMGRGHTPDVVTFGALIHGLVVNGKVSEALVVREKMTERQVLPDVNIYNVLISGLCKKHMLPAAKNILEEMLGQNVQPDEFVYATLIDGFIRSDNLVNGLTNSTPCVINSICCNTGEVHDKSAFLVVFKKFVLHIGDPRNSAYNAIIFSLCRHHMLREALDFSNRMSKKGYVPNPITFLSLLYGFCSVGKSMNWRTILPNEFRQEDFEMIFRYKILFDQYVAESVGFEVSRVLQQYLEGKSLQQMEQKFDNS
uniref:Phosphoglycerate mutase (2,3-diphosphoglycerate-dependent) n=1 Tax=Leersia perrieri TaxID=77586 RepID=A0A0D9XWP2_9ORYZ